MMIPIFIWHERSNELLVGRSHYFPPPLTKMAPVAMVFLFTIIVWAIVSLRRAYRDTDSPIRRKMLRFLFWASFLVICATISDINFMVNNKGIFPLSTFVGLGKKTGQVPRPYFNFEQSHFSRCDYGRGLVVYFLSHRFPFRRKTFACRETRHYYHSRHRRVSGSAKSFCQGRGGDIYRMDISQMVDFHEENIF